MCLFREIHLTLTIAGSVVCELSEFQSGMLKDVQKVLSLVPHDVQRATADKRHVMLWIDRHLWHAGLDIGCQEQLAIRPQDTTDVLRIGAEVLGSMLVTTPHK